MLLERRPLLTLTIAGILVHAGLLAVVTHRTGSLAGYASASLDCSEYVAIAKNVWLHGTFSQGEPPDLTPDTWRTPGYPLFLAMVIGLFGAAPVVLVLAGQVLAIGNVLLLFTLLRGRFGVRRAMLASLLFLLEPYGLYYSAWLLATTFFTTALLIVWLLWHRIQHAPTPARAMWLGVACGAAVLIRPVATLVPLALFLGILSLGPWRPGRGGSLSRGRRFMLAAVFGLSVFATEGSWMLRNKIVAGHFAMSHQRGVVLAYFKATEVALWRAGRTGDRYRETALDPARRDQPHPVWERIDRKLAERLDLDDDAGRAKVTWPHLAQGNKTDLDAFELSDALSRIGLELLGQDPLATAVCCLARCAVILAFPMNLAWNPPDGAAGGRIRAGVIGALYLALAMLAIFRLIRGRAQGMMFFFPAIVTVAMLLATTPQIDPRFRVPMIPLLIAMALAPAPAKGKPSA